MSDHFDNTFHEKRCTLCGSVRLKRRDGSAGACSFIHCKSPLHDVRTEETPVYNDIKVSGG